MNVKFSRRRRGQRQTGARPGWAGRTRPFWLQEKEKVTVKGGREEVGLLYSALLRSGSDENLANGANLFISRSGAKSGSAVFLGKDK